MLHARGHKDPRLLLTDTLPAQTDAALYACRRLSVSSGAAGSGSAGDGGTPPWCWPWSHCRPSPAFGALLARNRLWPRVWLTPTPGPNRAANLLTQGTESPGRQETCQVDSSLH